MHRIKHENFEPKPAVNITKRCRFTITMLISVIELSYAIQDDPRVYHSRSAIVNNENVIVFKRLLCFKVQQMQQLVDLVEAGCNTCTRIQIPPRDPTV